MCWDAGAVRLVMWLCYQWLWEAGCLVGRNLWQGAIGVCREMQVISVNYGGTGLKVCDRAFVGVGVGVR